MQNDDLLVNYLRVTSVLEIEKAGSGHPGICLGSAPIAYAIYKNANVFPWDSKNANRDRIVFSAGHASALYYATLHLFGYDVNVDDLLLFRQFGSRTPGHPEFGITDGVDATTGPLGQGVAMAVGMALAESHLRSVFATTKFSPIDHHTFCLAGDGCLMEGVAREAISLAGNLCLNRLILLYDKNDMTIEGKTSIANSDDIEGFFRASNWNVLQVEDGNNVKSIEHCISLAKKSTKPTIIVVQTKIGYASPLEDTNIVHGKPLDKKQIEALCEKLCYYFNDYEIPFLAKNHLQKILDKKRAIHKQYKKEFALYKKENPDKARLFKKYFDESEKSLEKFVIKTESKEIDFRKAGHEALNNLAKTYPNLIGGCADLSPSTKAVIDGGGKFCKENRLGKNISFGIREHAMGAVANGISLHGGLLPFCSTFLSFENYMTPPIRLSSMMEQKVLFYFTHDSLFVGEDGPTHQPVEQLATLRAMPNLVVSRPANLAELYSSLEYFVNGSKPMALCIPRQHLQNINSNYEKAKKGGYVISDVKNYDITIASCGSEIPLCVQASEVLKKQGIKARVVSVPCMEIFDKQPKAYKQRVIDKSKPVFCVEMSSDMSWLKYATDEEHLFNLSSFGKSGEGELVAQSFGFAPRKIAQKIKKILTKKES